MRRRKNFEAIWVKAPLLKLYSFYWKMLCNMFYNQHLHNNTRTIYYLMRLKIWMTKNSKHNRVHVYRRSKSSDSFSSCIEYSDTFNRKLRLSINTIGWKFYAIIFSYITRYAVWISKLWFIEILEWTTSIWFVLSYRP